MKQSLQNYIKNAGGFVNRDVPIPREDNVVVIEEDRPALTLVKNEKIIEESAPVVDIPLVEEAVVPQPVPVITEPVNTELMESLRDSINDLRAVLEEQQSTQLKLGKLVADLFKSVKTHNEQLNQRFESVDRALKQTSDTLLETTEKLSEISVREINVPTPVVNVSLTEQKKIIKTVDRDSNGLIRQITEETEQSVSK
jgi:hypothetical protein